MLYKSSNTISVINICDICNEYDDLRHILMKYTKYGVQRNLFRNQIIKYFGAFTMRAILGQAKSPKWVHRKTMLLLTKYIKSCNMHCNSPILFLKYKQVH